MVSRSLARLAFSAWSVALCLTVLTAEASAQDRLRWQMASGYSGSFVHLGTMGKRIETLASQISGGTFEINFMEPGALVPALQVMDGVSNGSIEARLGFIRSICWSQYRARTVLGRSVRSRGR